MLGDSIEKMVDQKVNGETRLCIFGRLPDKENYSWLHAVLVGGRVKEVIEMLNHDGVQVPHVDGPFASECALIIRAFDKKGNILFSIRMWNTRVSIQVSGDKTVSFIDSQLDTPEKIRELINKLKAKNEPGISVLEASELDILIDQLAIGDQQIK